MVALYLIVILLMRVVQGFGSKQISLQMPSSSKSYISYVALSKWMSAIFGVCTLIFTGFGGFNFQTLLIASASGAFLAISSFCSVKAYQGATIALNSICATAGLIVPSVLGIFIFDEPMSPVSVMCVAVFLISVVLLASSSKKTYDKIKPATIFLLIGSFLSNGLVMFFQKLFGYLQPNGNVTLFSTLTFVIPALVLSIMLAFVKPTEQATKEGHILYLPKKMYLVMLLLAVAVFIIQQFVTLLTPLLSSVVLFTIVNGGATIISSTIGFTFYKEKISVKAIIGLILGLVSLILIKLFG